MTTEPKQVESDEAPVPDHDPARYTYVRSGDGWKIVVEDLGARHARARFIAGAQSFVLADAEDDDEALVYCENAALFADVIVRLMQQFDAGWKAARDLRRRLRRLVSSLWIASTNE